MPLELSSQSVNPGQSAHFVFESPMEQFAVGISHFELSFGDTDHHVRTMSVSLSVTRPSLNEVVVLASAVLDDDSGHTIDIPASHIGVVCVASYEGVPAVLQNRCAIRSGGVSSPIEIKLEDVSTQNGFLSGYALSYGSDDHHLERASANVGVISVQPHESELTGHAAMADDSGNHAAVARVDGGLAAFGQLDEIAIRVLASEQTSSEVVAEFEAPVHSAAVLLQSWQVEFEEGNDHHVKTISAGTGGWSVKENQVILSGAAAAISDASGNTQDNARSSVNMLVIALQG